jgi:hypothetical protein
MLCSVDAVVVCCIVVAVTGRHQTDVMSLVADGALGQTVVSSHGYVWHSHWLFVVVPSTHALYLISPRSGNLFPY